MLTSRQKNIIHYFINQKHFIDIKKLAQIFQVSVRSIQYDLENIEYYANNLNLNIIRNKSEGVKLVPNELSEQYISDKTVIDVNYSPEERKEKILIVLFESLLPVNSNQLSKRLKVTRRTILEDLKIVEGWLNNRFLELVYLNNKGFLIKGDEKRFREAYVEILDKHYKMLSYYKKIKILELNKLDLIKQAIHNVLDKNQHRIIQADEHELIIHIAITFYRVKNNCKLLMPEKELENLRQKNEFYIIKEIQKFIKNKYHVTLSDSEIGYITIHLLAATKANIKVDYQMATNNYFISSLVTFIQRISSFTGVELTEDKILLDGLLTHLKPAIHRIHYQIKNENPLNEEIRHNYPNVLAAVESNIATLESDLKVQFNDDEINFITLHVGSAIERTFAKTRYNLKVLIICASGVGTSQLLKNKVENYYPEINIYNSFSIHDIDDNYFIKNGIDLVISTVPTPAFPVPVINVSPFLIKDDREKLNKILNEKREETVEHGLSEGPPLNMLTSTKYIQWNVEVTDWKEAVKLSTNLLIEQGLVTNQYTSNIINQFMVYGPYMVISQGIVMLHAKPSKDVIKPGISFIKLKHPVFFGHQSHDPVYFVICFATTNAHIHLNAIRQLSIVIQNNKLIDHVKGGDKESFLNLMNHISKL